MNKLVTIINIKTFIMMGSKPKLSLKKETITKLNDDQMKKFVGGMNEISGKLSCNDQSCDSQANTGSCGDDSCNC